MLPTAGDKTPSFELDELRRRLLGVAIACVVVVVVAGINEGADADVGVEVEVVLVVVVVVVEMDAFCAATLEDDEAAAAGDDELEAAEWARNAMNRFARNGRFVGMVLL